MTIQWLLLKIQEKSENQENFKSIHVGLVNFWLTNVLLNVQNIETIAGSSLESKTSQIKLVHNYFITVIQ